MREDDLHAILRREYLDWRRQGMDASLDDALLHRMARAALAAAEARVAEVARERDRWARHSEAYQTHWEQTCARQADIAREQHDRADKAEAALAAAREALTEAIAWIQKNTYGSECKHAGRVMLVQKLRAALAPGAAGGERAATLASELAQMGNSGHLTTQPPAAPPEGQGAQG